MAGIWVGGDNRGAEGTSFGGCGGGRWSIMDGLRSVAEIDFRALVAGRKYTPSPECWADQVLYFLMLDRFSDGKECGGYRDAAGQAVTAGTTRLATAQDVGAVPYDEWVVRG